MAEPHQPRIPGSARESNPMVRAAADRDFKPYVHPGDDEPPAVTAARERHRAVSARIAAAQDALHAREAGDE